MNTLHLYYLFVRKDYLIKLLRSQGMPESKLHVTFVALIISRIRPLSRIFKKIRLAETFFRLISGLAEFLRKLQYSAKIRLNTRNSAENTAEHQKFCYMLHIQVYILYSAETHTHTFTRTLIRPTARTSINIKLSRICFIQ